MLDKPSTQLEEKLKNIKPKYYWLVAAVISFTTFLLTFSVSEMLQNGRYTLLRMDMYSQYIPSIEYLMEVLKGNHGYWFSWSNFLGFGNSGLFAYLCMSPFNLIFLPFGKEHALTAVTLVVVLKSATAAAFMQRFLAYFLRSRRISTILFAVAYSLCGYQMAYYCVMNLTDALYLLPLIMLSIVKLIREGKVIPLIISYFLLFFSCFYMGYMIGIGSSILGLWYFIYTYKKRDRHGNIRIAVRYVCSVVTAVLMTAIIWLPAVIQIFKYGEEDYINPEVWKTNIVLILNNLLVGEFQDMSGFTPYVYCGLVTFFLAFSFFWNKKIKKREKLYTVILLLTLILLLVVKPLNYFMHAFDTPQLFGYRHAFLLSFALCVIACRESVYYRLIEKKTIIYFVVLCVGVFISSIFIYRNRESNPECNRLDVAVVNVLAVALWLCILYVGKKRKIERFTFSVILLAVMSCEIMLSGTMMYRQSLSLNYGDEAYHYTQIAHANTLEKIESPKENEFYRIQMMNEIQPNCGLEDDFYSVSSFSSSAPVNMFDVLHKLGASERIHTLTGKGLTPFMRSLLAVKYYSNYEVEELDDFVWCEGDYMNLWARYLHQKGENGSSRVEENDKTLSLGFMVDDAVKDLAFTESPFYNQNLLASKMCGCDINMFESAEWNCDTDNGVLLPYTRGESEELDKYVTFSGLNEGYLFVSKKEYDSNEHNKIEKEDYFADDTIEFDFIVKDNDKPVYGFINREIDYKTYVMIRTPEETDVLENSGMTHYLNNSYISALGHNDDGEYEESIILPVGVSTEFCYDISFAEYDEKEYEKVYDILYQNQMSIDKIEDGYVKGSINVKEDGVMFTSIPYDDGWQVYVDNNKVNPIALLEGAFLGIDLQKGEHDIEMKYTAAGAQAGGLLSGAGFALFAIIVVVSCWHSRKE